MTLAEAKALAISENREFEKFTTIIEEKVSRFSEAKTLFDLNGMVDEACNLQKEFYANGLVNGREDNILCGLIRDGIMDGCSRFDADIDAFYEAGLI